MGRDTAASVADNAWLRLTSRASLVVLTVLCTVFLPLVINLWQDMARGIQSLQIVVSELRGEIAAHRARVDTRLDAHEARLGQVEATLRQQASAPSGRRSRD